MSPSLQISMHLTLEVGREQDGRWIAEVPDLKGVLAHGASRDEAIASNTARPGDLVSVSSRAV